MEIRRVFVLALFLASLGDPFVSAALANDTRVRMSRPSRGSSSRLATRCPSWWRSRRRSVPRTAASASPAWVH